MSTQRSEFLSIVQPALFEIDHRDFEVVRYLLSRISGCWHLKLSRPFTHERESYRACLRCGMRRKFDLKTWKSSGRFYSPTVERKLRRTGGHGSLKEKQ